MDKKTYADCHRKEFAEARRERSENRIGEISPDYSESMKSINPLYIDDKARARPSKFPKLFKGIVLSAIIGTAIGYTILAAFNIARNYGRDEVIMELNELQEARKIKIFREQEIYKINKELEDRIDNERAKYYLKGLSEKDR